MTPPVAAVPALLVLGVLLVVRVRMLGGGPVLLLEPWRLFEVLGAPRSPRHVGLALEDQARARRQRELDRREADLARRERALAVVLHRAQERLAAAVARDVAADELDAVAEQRERELDLGYLLSPAAADTYGADWPARRQAALDRARAHEDRASARADLVALVTDCDLGPVGHDPTGATAGA